MPVWHASAARLGKNRTYMFYELTEKQIRKATRIAQRLLAGVGEGRGTRFRTEPPEHAVHIQKPLTAEEIAMLPPGWMDLPALDEVGPRVVF